MEWIKLDSQNKINNLMNDFNNFHDSCIKECSYISGIFVNKKEKNMQQDINNSNIKITLESQLCNSIEICFEEVKEVNIHSYDSDEYFNNISDVIFFIENNLIYWANNSQWNKNSQDKEITYIISKKAKYRNI